jgi:hypothetical protein
MPKYFFDIKDGHRLVDPTAKHFKSDEDAIAMAKVFAIQVSLDTPRVDPTRHISVMNEGRGEVAKVPVYSTPAFAASNKKNPSKVVALGRHREKQRFVAWAAVERPALDARPVAFGRSELHS